MDNANKSFSLLLIALLAASSLIVATPAFAQTPTPTPIPTPSVPQFTVQLVGPLFTFNTTYSLDPNSGKIVANIGYTNPYSYVELTIKNQPFNLSYGSLYYNVQIKNQNTITPNENWTVISWAKITLIQNKQLVLNTLISPSILKVRDCQVLLALKPTSKFKQCSEVTVMNALVY